MRPNKEAVVLFSGGIDSTTLLYYLYSRGFIIYPITIIYGQKHQKEIESAKKICKILGAKHKILDISCLSGILSRSALISEKVKIPDVPAGKKHFNTLKITVVPNRNSILLSIAVAYAQNIGVSYVFFGAHFSDRGVYPDCRKKFVKAFAISQKLACDNPSLKILAPFISYTKTEIIKLGRKLKVPYKLTWSCYRGKRVHCGRCSSCQERKRAFFEAKLPDPTVYSHK
jgi:7-cyano-7-deazaguanine synthase